MNSSMWEIYPRRFYGVSKWHLLFIGRVYICVCRCFTAFGASVLPWPLLDYTEEDVVCLVLAHCCVPIITASAFLAPLKGFVFVF